MTTSPTAPEPSEELKSRILDEGSIPKRLQLIEELAESMYKKGFKEAESLYREELAAALAKQDTQSRIAELESLREQTKEVTHPDAFISDVSVAQSIRVHTNSLIEYRLRKLQQPAELEAEDKCFYCGAVNDEPCKDTPHD